MGTGQDATVFITIFVFIIVGLTIGFLAFNDFNQAEDNVVYYATDKVGITLNDFKNAVGASSYNEKLNVVSNDIEKFVTTTVNNDITASYYDYVSDTNAIAEYANHIKYPKEYRAEVIIHERYSNGIVYGVRMHNNRYSFAIRVNDIMVTIEFGPQSYEKGISIVRNLWSRYEF